MYVKSMDSKLQKFHPNTLIKKQLQTVLTQFQFFHLFVNEINYKRNRKENIKKILLYN